MIDERTEAGDEGVTAINAESLGGGESVLQEEIELLASAESFEGDFAVLVRLREQH